MQEYRRGIGVIGPDARWGDPGGVGNLIGVIDSAEAAIFPQ